MNTRNLFKQEKEYRIIGFKADGFKSLTAVEMEFSPEGGLIFIRGDNEQGKTSILDCLHWLLAGKAAINDHVIQDGKDRVSAEINLDGYIIKRVKTQNTDRIEVKNSDGLSIQKPQEFLNKLFNKLTFNPWPFLSLDAEKKLKFMKDFCNIDFTEIDADIDRLEEDRRFTGRKSREFGEIQEVEEVEPVDVNELIQERRRLQDLKDNEITEIRKFNRQQEEKKEYIERLKVQLKQKEDDIEALKQQLEAAQKDKETVEQTLRETKEPEAAKSEESQYEEGLQQVDEKITKATEINTAAAAYQEYLKKKGEKDQLEEKYESYTNSIEAKRQEKREMLQDADTGVEGLEIREDGLYLNGTFSENWSDSQAMEVAAKLSAAMKPPLRALFVDRGESLGKKRLETLKAFAEKENIQVFITQVADEIPQEIPQGTFYIQEGRIRS